MTPNSQEKQLKSVWGKRILIALITLVIVFIIYVFICGMSYSEGSRAGVVIKLSKKGYIFKTNEGTLNLGGISAGDGTIMPTKVWDFSVQKGDTAIFNKITLSQGKGVRLYYKEVIKTFFWQGETKYFVYKTELVN